MRSRRSRRAARAARKKRPEAPRAKWQPLIFAGISYAILRAILLINPGYLYDVFAFKRWGLLAARYGISQVYQTSGMDYPPLYAYILAPVGKAYEHLAPEAYANFEDSTLLTVLFKLPPLVFDLAIGALLWRTVSRMRPGERTWHWRWIVPAAYLVNPAVLFNGGYWGEPDSVLSFFVLAAFLAIGWQRARRRAWPAWALLTLAMLMKPLGAVYFPLLLALSVALCGWSATFIGVAAALITTLVIFSPFLIAGQGADAARRIITDMGVMPFTSTNAHNLWWLFGAWRNAEVPWIGPMTATEFSMFLFGVFYVALLLRSYRLHREQHGVWQPNQILFLAAAVGFLFFMLSTHMHENHMFVVIPLLAPIVSVPGTSRRLLAGASLAVLANLVLHDPVIPERWPFTLGGPSGFENHHLQRPFYMTELGAVWVSTVFNLGLFAVFLFGLFRRDWLESLGRRRPVSAGEGTAEIALIV